MTTTIAYTLRRLCASISLAASALVLCGAIPASAFSTSDTVTALNDYTNAFWYTLNNGTQGYYRTAYGSGTPTSFWQFAEQIELLCDSGNAAMVNQACAGFTAQNGTDWSWNSYNDDLMWASIAFSRAYILTGNANYKTYAVNSFNTAYNRGWDTVNGGMWWNTGNTNKCSCDNGPGGIAAYLIYQNSGTSSYLTKAQAFHNWEIANTYNPTNGAVKGSPDGTDYNTYDAGTFVGTAYYLGDTTNMTKACDWVKNHWGPVSNWPTFGFGSDAGGFAGICFRWLAKAGYDTPYLQSVVNSAWALRDSEGLVCCNWNSPTPDITDPLYSWDCSDVVVGMLCVPPDNVPGSPVFTIQPSDQVSDIGNAVTLSAFATNGQPVFYQWYHENSPVLGATGTNLVLVNVSAADAGDYWVVASNSTASAYSQAAKITLFGVTNSIIAQDAASNYTYLPFPYNSIYGNQGFGFGSWVLNTPGGGDFIQNYGPSGQSFDLWNNTTNDTSTAVRPFNSALLVGASFSFQFRLNTLDTGTSAGIKLQDRNGNTLFNYYHNGGDNNNGWYSDASTTGGTAIGFKYNNSAFSSFTFTLTSATTYTFRDNTYGASISGTLSGAPSAQVAFFRTNGSGPLSSGDDIQFDSLAITVVPVAPSPSPLNLAKKDQGWSISFAVAPGYIYRVQRATNLAGPWTDVGTLVGPETGMSEFIDTNSLTSQSFYRTVTP